MRVTLAICVILGVAAQICDVGAVKCGDVSKCVKTDFTTETCEKNQCKCNTNYVATEEGCIKKPEKPTVEKPSENSDEAIEGKEVKLTCTGKMMYPGTTYKWWVDGKEDTSQKAVMGTFIMGSADTKYKCAVILDVAESDPSDEMTIKKLDGTSSSKPMVNMPGDVAENREFTPTCTNYPFGVDVTKEVKFYEGTGNSEVSVPIKQDKASASTKKITCTFTTSGFTFDRSDEATFPADIQTFKSVEVSPALPGPRAYKLADAPELTCNVVPPVQNLPSGFEIDWSWSEGTTTTAAWQLPKTKKEYDGLKCKAKKKGSSDTPTESAAVPKITIDDGYLKKPTVSPQPAKPFATSQVSLTCATEEKDVQVSWSKGGSLIVGQMDKTIQYGDIATSLNGDFKCMITKNGFTAESDAFKLQVAADIEKPTIEGEAKVGKWGTLKLECKSENAVPAMTYAWSKAGKIIAGATGSIYTVEEVEKSNEGEYTCTTKFGKLDAKTSDKVIVTVVAPGKECTDDNQCDGKDKSLTGKCDTKTKRCVCANRYYARGSECGNGVEQMAASLIFVMVAALISRLV